MRFTFLLFSFFILYSPLFGQQDLSNPVLNHNGLTYDSVIYILNQEDIPFEEKFRVIRKDIIALDPLDKTTDIFIRTLRLAEKEDAKEEIFTLYNVIANNYILSRNTEHAKIYLDSASLYLSNAKEPHSLGIHFHLLSSYFYMVGDARKSTESSYKALEYLEKSEGSEKLAIYICYDMCLEYNRVDDHESLKKVVDKMQELNKKSPSFDSEILINQQIATYYEILYEKNKTENYLDSVKLYYKRDIDLFNSLNDIEQSIAKIPILHDYSGYINSDLRSQHPNSKLLNEYISAAETLIEPTDTIRQVILYRSKGLLLMHEQKYEQAEKQLLESLELLDNLVMGKEPLFYTAIYEALSDVYLLLGNNEKFIRYRNLKEDAQKAEYETKRYEAVKDLDIKYETAEKELEISRLNEERQKAKLRTTLVLSVVIFLLILSVIAFLYNRIKRLNKEKEAILLASRIKQKEEDYQSLKRESEAKQLQHYLDGLETERDRIAKELHDNVANELVIIGKSIQKDGDRIISTLPRIEQLHHLVRNLSHDLISPSFQYASLGEILFLYVHNLNEDSKTIFQINIDDESLLEELNDQQALEVYRIIQEATSNIVKHASAQNAWINIAKEDRHLIVSIEDDGKGFDHPNKSNGVGLQIIGDRVRKIGGKIDIESTKEKGTKIYVKIAISYLVNADE